MERSDLTRIKAIRIQDIANLKFQRAGKYLKACCPFHHETTPSFVVYPDNHFHCFGCQAHGSVIDFVMESRGIDFKTACNFLSDGHTLPPANVTARDVRKEERERKRRYDIAAKHAEKIVEGASLAPHSYLAAKGFRDQRGLVGKFNDVFTLIVPIWNRDNKIRSVEFISPDGTKRFLPGGEIGGNFQRLGRSRSVWLCEGYATGLSVRAALRARSIDDEVRVCLSAGNMKRVAGEMRSHETIRVIADRDWWKCRNGHKWDADFSDTPDCHICGTEDVTPPTGERVAREIGAPYWLPQETSWDANDVHRHHGLDYLATELREFRRAYQCP